MTQDTPMTDNTTSMIEKRFWARVDKTDADGCWTWTGTKIPAGYGTIRVGEKTKRATHVAILLETGEWPEPGMVVCHHCDNPPCVRHDHLFVGTIAENNRDRHRKGRSVMPRARADQKARGVAHGNSKLNDDLVRKIRSETGLTFIQLGHKYGVSDETIASVVKRKTWRHVEQVA